MEVDQMEEKRIEPELKAREKGTHRAPGFEQVDGKIPDPSGDTEITEEDQNKQTNDSSFAQYDEEGGHRPGQ
jgi:hypothetical protein